MDRLNSESSYQIHTFGCKVNTYDSGLLEKKLAMDGFQQKNGSHIHVLNTCAVTHEATREALRLSRKIKSKDPLSLVVVTGCGAQVDTTYFEQAPAVDLVVANSDKVLLPDIIRKHYAGLLKQKVFKSNIFKKEDLEMGGGIESHHTRAFLKIQDGCNSFCSFCIIPYARGLSRSLPIKYLIEKIKEFESQQIKEVVLTGIHIGDYEDQSNPNQIKRLEDLVEAVLLQTQIPRVRLTSLEPPEVSGRLLAFYKEDRMCSHIHLSIQSASTSVLQEMKRKYTQAHVEECLNKISDSIPGVYVGMDVIAGFPSETEIQFQETYDTLTRTPWTRLHVFPYSVRPGTKAALIPAVVRESEKSKRAQFLRTLSQVRLLEKTVEQVNQTKKVLLLKNKEGLVGLSRDYWNISFQEKTRQEIGTLQAGDEIDLLIHSYEGSDSPRGGVLIA